MTAIEAHVPVGIIQIDIGIEIERICQSVQQEPGSSTQELE
jgi:hypothetical protein